MAFILNKYDGYNATEERILDFLDSMGSNLIVLHFPNPEK